MVTRPVALLVMNVRGPYVTVDRMAHGHIAVKGVPSKQIIATAKRSRYLNVLI